MLKNTFLHFPSIGLTKERTLWEQGILNWDDFDRSVLSQATLFPTATEQAIAKLLDQSRTALEKGDFDFFALRLPKREHYRVALENPHKTIFLDIETTGLSFYYDQTTLIGVANTDGYRLYIRGQELAPIAEALADAKCIVTFNGTLFDLKFLQQEFPQLPIPKAHVDLRFFGRAVGLIGSQKKIEQDLRLARPQEIRGIRGEAAPLLWFKYESGDFKSGVELAEYNFSDVEGMKRIFDVALERHLARNPILSKVVRSPRFYGNKKEFRWTAKVEDLDRDVVHIPKLHKEIMPKLTYNDLAIDQRARTLRIVGIDLTGSEARPTGWCLLDGDHATTKALLTDQELFEETVASKPDLVSIDSPLSLPRGRKRVTDDDPGRGKFGIMRECERILKKRGVNVYPCLINSMQRLTARGIRLAKQFRKAGIPVIESYPGAAQDIMGIPRKRAGLDYLKMGLKKFGIKGAFLTEKVSHDEVDAVTSAVVGLFFWSGKFEGLGNRDEEYLIIPDLNVSPDPWRQRSVVGISGPIASGKTTGARFLEQQAFTYGRYSQVLAAILAKRGKPITRDTLQKIGEQVHRRPGQRWLSQELVESLPQGRNLVIDGLRFPEDHAFLVESFGPGFFHLHVEASESIRRSRHLEEGHTAREFEEAISHHVEAEIPKLASHADATLLNNRSKQEYQTELLKIIHRSER